MTENTRDTSGTAAAARYLKGLERRIQSNEEDLRGEEAAVPLERTVTLDLELQSGPTAVYYYDADTVLAAETDWDDLHRRWKMQRLIDNHTPRATTTSQSLTTDGLRNWVGRAVDPSADARPVDRLALGTGEGDWRSSNAALYDQQTVVPSAQRVISGGNAYARFLLDAGDYNGMTFTEAGNVDRREDFLATHGPLNPTLSKTSADIIRIDMPLKFHPYENPYGSLTTGFRRFMAYQSLTVQAYRRPPLATATVGTGRIEDAPETETQIPGAVGDVPVADWSSLEGSPMLTIAIDSTRLNGHTLRGFGITNDDPLEQYRLHSIARIDPPIEKTASKRVTINTILDIQHETHDLDHTDATILVPAEQVDALPLQGVTPNKGITVFPPEGAVSVEAETPRETTNADAAVLPGRSTATVDAGVPTVAAVAQQTRLVDDFSHADLATYYDAQHSLIRPETYELTTSSRSNWPKRGDYSIQHRRDTQVARMASTNIPAWSSTTTLGYYPKKGDEMVVFVMPTRASPTSGPFRTRFRWGWEGTGNNYDITLDFSTDTAILRERRYSGGQSNEYTLDDGGMGEWGAFQVLRLEILWQIDGSFRARIYDDATDTLRLTLTGAPEHWTTNAGGIEFITEIAGSLSGNIRHDWVHVKR